MINGSIIGRYGSTTGRLRVNYGSMHYVSQISERYWRTR